MKNWTARSCRSAASRLENVPRFRRFPERGENPGADLNDPADGRSLRLPDVHQLNLQLRANLAPALGRQIDLYAAVINPLGLRTPTAVVKQDGRLGQVLTRTPTTSARLGFRFKH